MRHRSNHGFGIVMAVVSQLLLTAVTRSFAAECFQVEVGGRSAAYRSLDETYQFSPLNNFVPFVETGWERQWREERAWVRATCDLQVGEHVLLRPGFLIGSARGSFTAGNGAIGFSEEWRTSPGLLGGLSLAGEMRADRAHGVFLRVQYQYSQAQASEDHESIVSDGPANPDDRDARFHWQQSELAVGLGCRWGSFEPVAGMAYSRLRLQKWLSYHIPETGSSGVGQEISSALNGTQSEYHFVNTNPWAPFLGLSWQVSRRWAVFAGGTLAVREDYCAGVRMSL